MSDPLDEAALARLEALANAATPGPWQWFGDLRNYQVYLSTVEYGRRFVMKFRRWGMSGAQPVFQIDDRMVTLSDFQKPDKSYRGDFTGIDHPDAAFIAEARSAVPALIAALRAARAERDEARTFAKAETRRADANWNRWDNAVAARHQTPPAAAPPREGTP